MSLRLLFKKRYRRAAGSIVLAAFRLSVLKSKAKLNNLRLKNMERSIPIKLKSTSREYRIVIGNSLLENCGEWAKDCLGDGSHKIAIISNAKVYGIYGDIITKSLRRAGFKPVVWLMKDGERHKNMRSLEAALAFLSENGFSRTDAVAALGGGVAGDLAGFAAAVYMRGIEFLQIPTSLLAMIDSSVGGKTAVNTAFGKNLVGAFHQPTGVLIDTSTLTTLPQRELTAGFCEAVKQGAIGGISLFNQTYEFLCKYRITSFAENALTNSLGKLIASQVAFKAGIVRQDETESTGRIDARSRKILNFGHTFAHALEKVTSYRYFKHGEAVGYGILFAANLSKKLEILSENELNLLNDVVHRTGKLPAIPEIDPKVILEAIKLDKKSVNGSLNWILLNGIGNPVIRSAQDVPQSAVIDIVKKIVKA